MRALRNWRWMMVGLAICAASTPAGAQFSNQCQTMQGICQVNPAPFGSPCGCFTPFGSLQGQIVGGAPMPGSPFGGGMPPGQRQLSNACRTFRGACPVYPQPVGTPCNCFGDPGVTSP